MVSGILYHLDRLRKGCPRPGMLGKDDRLQGYVVLEALGGNIHPHFLFPNPSHLDQVSTGLFLFKHLDTCPRNRYGAQDEFWQDDAWRCLQKRKEVDFRSRTSSPLLRRFAPGGTAMVQLVRDQADRQRVNKYFTKELSRSSLALAYQSAYWSNLSDLRIRELSEFHSRDGYEKPATRVRIDPETGCQTLNLDDKIPWKRGGRRIR